MRKLLILCLLLYNFNSLAEEYCVVCQLSYNIAIINNIENYSLALEAVEQIKNSFLCSGCEIVKTKN